MSSLTQVGDEKLFSTILRLHSKVLGLVLGLLIGNGRKAATRMIFQRARANVTDAARSDKTNIHNGSWSICSMANIEYFVVNPCDQGATQCPDGKPVGKTDEAAAAYLRVRLDCFLGGVYWTTYSKPTIPVFS